MSDKHGLTFADILIILAVILLLGALTVPLFRRSRSTNAESPAVATNVTDGVTNAAPAAMR